MIRGWNTRARDLWGLIEDEVRGVHFLNVDIGLPVDQLRTPIRKVLAGDGEEVVTLPAVNRRGSQIRCRVTVTPMGAEGNLAGVILMMEVEE
jgi:two-component system CheB/CheR fusion protein